MSDSYEINWFAKKDDFHFQRRESNSEHRNQILIIKAVRSRRALWW